MQILVISADLVPGYLGGAEQHLVEVIKKLQNKHRFTLLVGKDTSIKNQFLENVRLIPVKYPKITNLYGIFFIICGYFKGRQELKKTKYDLIWAKQSFPQAPLGALFSKHYKIPLYITAQNPKLLSEEYVVKGRILKPFHNFLAKLIEPVIKWSYRNASLVAAVSQYSVQIAEQFGARRTCVIPNGVKPENFKRPAGKKLGTFHIISTSALIPRNGLDTLIEAATLLTQSYKWKITIAGIGPEETKLKDLIKKHSLQSKVQLAGRIRNEEIPSFLNKADIFVRPSRKEGFGVSFIEAMAAGVPVIATPVGGIPDFLKHEETGLLVDPDNPEQLAENIERLVADKPLYKAIQKNSQELIKKRYNWQTIAVNIEIEMMKLIIIKKA